MPELFEQGRTTLPYLPCLLLTGTAETALEADPGEETVKTTVIELHRLHLIKNPGT
jgi:hypothetical protein